MSDSGHPSCPVCRDPVKEPLRVCERCKVPHHLDCWNYVSGCAVFACRPGSSAGRREEDPQVVLLARSLRLWLYLNLAQRALIVTMASAPIIAMTCGIVWVVVGSLSSSILQDLLAYRWAIVSYLFWPFVIGFTCTFSAAASFIVSLFLEFGLARRLETELGRSVLAVKEWEASLLARRDHLDAGASLEGYDSALRSLKPIVFLTLLAAVLISIRLGTPLAGIQVLGGAGFILMLSVPFFSKAIASYESRALYIDTLRNRLALMQKDAL